MSGPCKVLRKRILLADDLPEVREIFKLMLSIDQHIVTEARNGQEALDLFERDRFDLVITDYAMPVMRGDELAANIKRVAPSQPVLMITGSAEDFSGFETSVDIVLNKPISLEDLRQAMSKLLSPVPV
jgi:two-component system, response regulator YesN